MKRKFTIPFFILVIFMIFPSGCHREEFNWGVQIGDLVYSEDVVFLGPDELGLLEKVTVNEMVFTNNSGVITKIVANSILITGVSDLTPYGLLRKVNSIQMNGSQIVLSTSDAELTDAVIEGTIHIQKVLLNPDFELKSIEDGVLINESEEPSDELSVILDELEMFKEGERIATLGGTIGIIPELNLTIKVKSGKIKEVNIITILNKRNEITITSNGAFNGSSEVPAAVFVHSPITIDSLIFIPEVEFNCGFDGMVSSALVSEVNQNRTLTSKIYFTNSSWTEDPLAYSETYSYTTPQITDNSNLKIFSGPEVSLRLMGNLIQNIKVNSFFSINADKASSPFWRLSVGTEGLNIVMTDFLGMDSDYPSNISITSREIANSNGK